jgi:hypothetical protein
LKRKEKNGLDGRRKINKKETASGIDTPVDKTRRRRKSDATDGKLKQILRERKRRAYEWTAAEFLRQLLSCKEAGRRWLGIESGPTGTSGPMPTTCVPIELETN